MQLQASFGDSVQGMELSYNGDDVSFRLPVQFSADGDIDDDSPTVEIMFVLEDDGDDGLSIRTPEGDEALGNPVTVPLREVNLRDDVDETLYKFVATSTTGKSFDGETLVHAVVLVNGEQEDREHITFWNTIRAY